MWAISTGYGSARKLRELIGTIEADPAAERDFAAEARKLGWSVDHFRRVLRRATGHTPVAFLNRARLDQAAGILRASDRPIKAIAERCGLPPGQYRRVFQLRATEH